MGLPGEAKISTYRGHNSLALEPPTNTVVNTLGFAPAASDTHKAVALVAVEERSAYEPNPSQRYILS